MKYESQQHAKKKKKQQKQKKKENTAYTVDPGRADVGRDTGSVMVLS